MYKICPTTLNGAEGFVEQMEKVCINGEGHWLPEVGLVFFAATSAVLPEAILRS